MVLSIFHLGGYEITIQNAPPKERIETTIVTSCARGICGALIDRELTVRAVLIARYHER